MAKSVSRRSRTHERKAQQQSSSSQQPSPSPDDDVPEASDDIRRGSKAVRPVKTKTTKTRSSAGWAAAEWLSMLGLLMLGMWGLFRYQLDVLPPPVSERAAGIRGFSEERAYKHVQALTSLGPHPVGSHALNRAVQYVLDQVTETQETANIEVEVDVDYFHAKPGVIQLKKGLFAGRSLVYSGLKHVVVRVRPKYEYTAKENALLVSTHIDTVITAEGAGDCSSCVAVSLELLRALSHWAQGFQHSVIFLFNTGEEEGLIGSHSFMTQHPWRRSIRGAIDLEAMGVGGKSFMFQGGPDKWLVDTFAKTAKRPATMMLAQDMFHSGLVKSATDFQIFREIAGLSGLDFAFMENAGVYHTKNDKLSLLRPGSLQHSGDNMLPFLRAIATASELASRNMSTAPGFSNMDVVYWDILGFHMVTYTQNFAKLLHFSIVFQLAVLQISAIYLAGAPSLIAAILASLTIYLTWCFAIGLTLLVAMVVPALGQTAVPFLASPWLVIPLYCAPAAMAALVGHHFGHMLLVGYLWHVEEEKQLEKSGVEVKERGKHAPGKVLHEVERWLYKAAIMQWVLVLGLATWANAGAAYLAFAWVVSPTVAYGLLEMRLSPLQALAPLRRRTLLLGVLVPAALTALPAFHFPRMLINLLVNFDRNPGGLPEWTGSVMIACVCATITTLMLTYLLPYVHRSGGLPYILTLLGALFLFSLAAVAFSVFPAFTPDTGRAINVVHVINTDGTETDPNSSFLSLATLTMGSLNEEAKHMNDENLVCSRNETLDFATYTVKYGCQKPVPLDETLWQERPSLVVIEDTKGPPRVTTVRLSTGKARRWFLVVNSNKISTIQLESTFLLIPATDTASVDGWYDIQSNFVGAGDPSTFLLTLQWSTTATDLDGDLDGSKLLKLRTDVDVTTPEAARMLADVPDWCLSFGKSTSPYPLAYLASLPVGFSKESTDA